MGYPWYKMHKCVCYTYKVRNIKGEMKRRKKKKQVFIPVRCRQKFTVISKMYSIYKWAALVYIKYIGMCVIHTK